MKKRVLIILLALAVAFSMIPLIASAGTASETSYVIAKASVSGSHAIKLSWNETRGADKYVVYGQKCSSKYKKLKTLKGTSYTVKSISGKKLKSHKSYKFYVVAYDGSKKLAKSRNIHFITANTMGSYANASKVTAKYDSRTLAPGKTVKLSATVKIYKGKKHLKSSHGAKLKYISSNPAVAKVDSAGKVTAKKAGTAKIYIQDISGRYDVTKIIVKAPVVSYSVAFDVQGHGKTPSLQKVKKGAKATCPQAPSEEGYIFGGWFKEKTCSTAWRFDYDTASSNMTLYAKWIKIEERTGISLSMEGYEYGAKDVEEPELDPAAETLKENPAVNYYFRAKGSNEWQKWTPAADAGDYEIKAVIGATKSYLETVVGPVDYTVAKTDWNVTPPEAKNLICNDEEQVLVETGKVKDISDNDFSSLMEYSLDGKEYSSELPSGTEAGDYEVYYRVEGNQNYSPYACENPVKVTIAEKTYTAAFNSAGCMTALAGIAGIPKGSTFVTSGNTLTVTSPDGSVFATREAAPDYEHEGTASWNPSAGTITEDTSIDVSFAEKPPADHKSLQADGIDYLPVFDGKASDSGITFYAADDTWIPIPDPEMADLKEYVGNLYYEIEEDGGVDEAGDLYAVRTASESYDSAIGRKDYVGPIAEYKGDKMLAGESWVGLYLMPENSQTPPPYIISIHTYDEIVPLQDVYDAYGEKLGIESCWTKVAGSSAYAFTWDFTHGMWGLDYRGDDNGIIFCRIFE